MPINTSIPISTVRTLPRFNPFRSVSDVYFTSQFVKQLTTPFNKTKEFKQGIIDKHGDIIHRGTAKGDPLPHFTKLVFKIKQALEKSPNLAARKLNVQPFRVMIDLLKEEAVKEMFNPDLLESAFVRTTGMELNESDSSGTSLESELEDRITIWFSGDSKEHAIESAIHEYLYNKIKRAQKNTESDFQKYQNGELEGNQFVFMVAPYNGGNKQVVIADQNNDAEVTWFESKGFKIDGGIKPLPDDYIEMLNQHPEMTHEDAPANGSAVVLGSSVTTDPPVRPSAMNSYKKGNLKKEKQLTPHLPLGMVS